MKWDLLAVEDYNEEERQICTVCGQPIEDVIYGPRDMDNDDIYWIEKIWKCDAFEDFRVCETCMMGHCGAVPGLNTNNWLQAHIKSYKKDPKKYDD